MQKLFIGLMSGTSMDGIDAALADVESHTFFDGITMPYDEKVRQLLLEAMAGKESSIAFYNQLNTLIGREFAKAANALLARNPQYAKQVLAIGSHGQTICHDADATIPYTVQLGCPHSISELTGKTTVADFRVRDLLAGGKGAPFAPIYHRALFENRSLPALLINIGGISNISYITKKKVTGYDVGPGNCLLDAWVYCHTGYTLDRNGEWARSGNVIPELLEAMLMDPYFKLPAPKSIGKEYFSLSWLAEYKPENWSASDVQATLLALTAQTIAHAVNSLPESLLNVYICGGGVHNQFLMDILAKELPRHQVCSTSDLGINPDFIEAMLFAWLAEKTLSGTLVDLQSITGAHKRTLLGAIYPQED